MRNPQDLLRRRSRRGVSGRGRGLLVAIAIVVVALTLSLRAIARLYTDFLWFDALGVSAAWQRQWGYQGLLALVFALAFFVLVYANQLIADRIAPAVVTRRNGDELVERYRELVGPRQRSVRLASSAVFGIIAGLGASAQWQNLVLFRFGGSFGTKDALNDTDLSFYVFKLPFLTYVLSWTFAAMTIVILVVAMTHYLNGALHLPGSGASSSPRVKTHLSVLFAVLALIKAADYWLDRYLIANSRRGDISGAQYTDVKAVLPANMLLILIAVLVAGMFLFNIRRKGWGLPLIGLGLWVLMAIVAGTAYPAAIQKLQVDSKESALEAKYIARNIKATRAALGLDRVVERNYDYRDDIDDGDITANASTVSNVRLLDPEVVPDTFTALQALFNYYRFPDLDVDRYQFNGEQTEVIIGARELNQAAIPTKTWEGRHLSYTHGYGVAMAPANAVNSDGEPDFAIGNVPIKVDGDQLDLTIDRPEIYFGEGLDTTDEAGYAIVGTSLKEKSVGESEGGDQYEGGGGVAIDSFVRKAAFALRFGDLEPVTSDYLQSESRVLFIRDIRERVSQVAPFLHWDADPYPIVVGGGIQYVVDGYTISSSVPYAQQVDTSGLDPESGLAGQNFNYVRNSVKALVSAYDGSITMYLTDELYGAKDPIIRGFNAAFPELFTSVDEMPDDVKDHLRYPEDLFRVQTAMWGRYHLDEPGDFYDQQDGWDVAQDPPNSLNGDAAADSTTSRSIAAQYLQMRLPEETSDEFVLFRPFVPHSDSGSTSPKKQLNAFMVGRSDRENYGTLAVYTMTQEAADGTIERNRAVDGPLTAHDNMQNDQALSERLTLLNGQGGGSRVMLGNMVMVPIDQGLMYVRPIYVAGEGSGAARQLRIVVVFIGGKVAIGDTLAEALGKLFPTAKIATREGAAVDGPGTDTPGTDPGTDPPTETPDPDAPDDTTAGTAAELIARAVTLFDEADEALRTGGATSLSEYQTKAEDAQELVRRAQDLLAAGGTAAAVGSTDTGSAGTGPGGEGDLGGDVIDGETTTTTTP